MSVKIKLKITSVALEDGDLGRLVGLSLPLNPNREIYRLARRPGRHGSNGTVVTLNGSPLNNGNPLTPNTPYLYTPPQALDIPIAFHGSQPIQVTELGNSCEYRDENNTEGDPFESLLLPPTLFSTYRID